MIALDILAREAGIAVNWTDAAGLKRRVPQQTLHALLKALGLAAQTPGDIAASHDLLRERQRHQPLVVVVQGEAFAAQGRRIQLLGDGDVPFELRVVDGQARADVPPGYYRFAGSDQALAVAPARAFRPEGRFWGAAAQLYALRGSPGIGDFGALADFCDDAARAGADAVMLSPVHALPAGGISPYSPASRRFLNPLYIPRAGKDAGSALIDWPAVTRDRLASLQTEFHRFQAQGGDKSFDAFVRAGGAALRQHAGFESGEAGGLRFQLYLQWRADTALAAAQARARAAGMAIGLISDVAVGVDPHGSEAADNKEMLQGVSIGAPPDAFNSEGQNWNLTSFSPEGLVSSGYGGFLAMLRAAMRHAGGIRIDHAMGMMRLWVIPEGMAASEGAYLHYPLEQLLGLLCLESQRHRALVIAEDLGTVPPSFRRRIRSADLLGMEVLWFARDTRGHFMPPSRWPADRAALTTTHDLPTLAGWWQGHDLAWRERITGTAQGKARKTRARDKRALAKLLHVDGAASAAQFADAAIAALAASPAGLVLIPVEDLVGEAEQPNIPGTVRQHPNWRRRYRRRGLFDLPSVKRRTSLLRRS